MRSLHSAIPFRCSCLFVCLSICLSVCLFVQEKIQKKILHNKFYSRWVLIQYQTDIILEYSATYSASRIICKDFFSITALRSNSRGVGPWRMCALPVHSCLFMLYLHSEVFFVLGVSLGCYLISLGCR